MKFNIKLDRKEGQCPRFLLVMQKAQECCKNSGHTLAYHMEDMLTMVNLGSGAQLLLNFWSLKGKTTMTKRPWVAQHWQASTYSGGSVLEYTIHDADGNKLADFVKPEVVNLMTAAPELLEALEMFITIAGEALDHLDSERDTKALRALIAKEGYFKEYDKRIDAVKTILRAKGKQL